MQVHEIRDPELARDYCAQGLWLQRILPSRSDRVPEILSWSLEVADAGEPLPALGFVADVGHLIFQPESGSRHEAAVAPGWPAGLARIYEDHVLGRLYADTSFERAGDALRRYQGRDRARGLAFLINQLRLRAGLGGVLLSPAVVKSLRDQPPDEVLGLGWQSLTQEGPLPLLRSLYDELVVQIRNSAAVLGPEDVFELEHGTALTAFSQRVALRQVLQAASGLEALLPLHQPRPLERRHEVPTRILDEDTYPVGGFSSISNRGTIESLLHSQLAYMEPVGRPDLFDIKFLRDELLYYSRDENQFRRQRRSFVFALHADLEHARFKDGDLPWQRIVLALGLALAGVRKLLEWLTADALLFEILFLDESAGPPALVAEQALMETVLREQVANGSVVINRLPRGRLSGHCAQHARRSRCHCLAVATKDRRLEIEGVQLGRLVVAGPCPALAPENEEDPQVSRGEHALASWTIPLENWLRTCL
jgi:hypothetical protein